jgi:putative hydrolase of the HAD superfamily
MVRNFHWIGFDADDTLWHSEDGFEDAKRRYVALMEDWVPDRHRLESELLATERRNMHAFGYGVRSFGLSMIETAVNASDGTVPASVIGQLVAMTREHLMEPVRVLPGVEKVLQRMAERVPLILITKGDLLHQTSKVASSGLRDLFTHVEVVLEKDPDTYQRILERHGIDPSRFLMVGNSVRSDILPVLAIGGHGVHVPYPLLWELEHHDPDHGHEVVELASLEELPAWLGW